MAAKGRGGGKTPERVVELVNKAVSEKSLRAVSKETGLGIAALSRYTQGIGEPSQATLGKLADYFGVTTTFLRGGDIVGDWFSDDRIQEALAKVLDGVMDKFIERNPNCTKQEIIDSIKLATPKIIKSTRALLYLADKEAKTGSL